MLGSDPENRDHLRDAIRSTRTDVRTGPQVGSFRLSPAEVYDLVDEVAAPVRLKVDGVGVGMLARDGHVDHAAVADAVRRANEEPVIFHRAFDEVDDPLSEVKLLIRPASRGR